ncbi:hypothetical protein D3C81_1437240 [compost metagenome]
MAEGVVDVAKAVQVQVAEGDATSVALRQAGRQQCLETLAIGDTGQWILLGKPLQGGDQHAALTHMAQRASQGIGAELITHQPVTDGAGRCLGFVIEQQDGRQITAPRRWLQGRRGQYHRLTVMDEQAVDCFPVRRGQQHRTAPQRQQTLTQPGRPFRLIGQQQQTQGFDRRGQAGSLGLCR